ncbi:MAG: hybrid sensor histidine kinase/response regulator [Verrucomicrobiales bacterium]|nr:hybrid sensor histidine kinase/response regulator [Verrucomicrobiales bacterium]
MQFPDYGILYIDDEEKSLKYFEAIFGDIAPIYTASSPEEGFRVFAENHERIGLVLSDKKMPNESGIDLLARIRALDPRPLRFLVTAFSDLGAAVEFLNEGLLYSYLTKPWDPEDLEHRLLRALKHFSLERDRERLIAEKSEMVDQLLMADKAATIGILSTGLNHHIRNALTVFRTFYDMLPFQIEEELGRQPSDDSFWGEFYGEVGGQINRMTSMLSSLSEGAELILITESKEFCLKEVIESAIEISVSDLDDCQVDFEVTEGLPLISGEAPRISQMIRLILKEAKTALPNQGGHIKVHARPRRNGKGVKITIVDNGELIPEEDLKNLFEPFYVRTQRPEDLGSNFLACYLTAFSHGGSIRAFRAEGEFNAIEVCLPLVPPVVESQLTESYRYPAENRKETILPA